MGAHRARSIEVERCDPATSRVIDSGITLQSGEVLASVDRFAITANNATYANLGDTAGYWQFFPACAHSWGIVPAWGYITVTASEHPGVSIGDRFYGFVPMASHVVIAPSRIRPTGLVDAAGHRATLPAVYNFYANVATSVDDDDLLWPVLAPVFMLSFLINEELAETVDPTMRVLITSASAKAAIGTAYLLHARGVRTIGATSTTNHAFCARLSCYDHVVPYGDIAGIDRRPTVLVDIAGNPAHRTAIEQTLGPALQRTIAAGLTHAAPNSGVNLDDLFSAPAHIVKLSRRWGRDEFDQRTTAALISFVAAAAAWLEIITVTDPDRIRTALHEAAVGTAAPHQATLATLSVD
ncbi:MAG: DUF2855 family protein [Actinomycetota bacterium]